MTDSEWKSKLNSAIAGKVGLELEQAKRAVFQDFANRFPDEYA